MIIFWPQKEKTQEELAIEFCDKHDDCEKCPACEIINEGRAWCAAFDVEMTRYLF